MQTATIQMAKNTDTTLETRHTFVKEAPWNNIALVINVFNECYMEYATHTHQTTKTICDTRTLRNFIQSGKCRFAVNPNAVDVKNPTSNQYFRLVINDECSKLLENLNLRIFLGQVLDKLYYLHTHEDQHIKYLEKYEV